MCVAGSLLPLPSASFGQATLIFCACAFCLLLLQGRHLDVQGRCQATVGYCIYPTPHTRPSPSSNWLYMPTNNSTLDFINLDFWCSNVSHACVSISSITGCFLRTQLYLLCPHWMRVYGFTQCLTWIGTRDFFKWPVIMSTMLGRLWDFKHLSLLSCVYVQCVYVCVCVQVCHSAWVETRGQFPESIFILHRGSWGLNSDSWDLCSKHFYPLTCFLSPERK